MSTALQAIWMLSFITATVSSYVLLRPWSHLGGYAYITVSCIQVQGRKTHFVR